MSARAANRSRLLWPLGGLLTGLAAGLLSWLWRSAGDGGQYLSLQAASDGVHRFSLLIAPGVLLGLILCWTLSEIGRLGGWLSTIFRLLVACLLALGVGTAGHLVLFDLGLERAGRLGQWVQKPQVDLPEWPEARGLWAETSAAEPNLETEDLGLGANLTLDRRSLALRNDTGGFRWNRPRPGPAPASLLLSGEQVVYAGPGPVYEDDLVVSAVDLRSGRKLWECHVLGRAITRLFIERGKLRIVAWRPSGSTLYELDWPRIRVVAFDGEVTSGGATGRHLRKPPESGQGAQATQAVP